MLLHYFNQAWRSTRKALLISHVTWQVSPDFCLFRNFWKEKRSQVSPPTQPNFLVFGAWFLICDAWFLICVLSNGNFDVPYLRLWKWFSPETLSVSNWPPAMLHTKFQVSSSPGTYFSKIQIWPKSAVNRFLNLPKTKKFDCVGSGDLTSLFKSCEIDRSQGRFVLYRGK